MVPKVIEDHPFIPSKREDSCDFAWYPEGEPWIVCDCPQAQHARVAKGGRLSEADLIARDMEGDELRAEAERLETERDSLLITSLSRFDEIELLGRERDELRVERNSLRERFESACDLLGKMQAHLERAGFARLGESYADTVLPRLIAERDALRVENEQLRAERAAADRQAQLERVCTEEWRGHHQAAVARAEAAEAQITRLKSPS